MKTRNLLVAALLAASVIPAAADGYVYRSDCNEYRCTSYFGPRTYDNSAKIIEVPAAENDEARDASIAADRKWLAYCKPTPTLDALGVTRLVYAQPGCEFGRTK